MSSREILAGASPTLEFEILHEIESIKQKQLNICLPSESVVIHLS